MKKPNEAYTPSAGLTERPDPLEGKQAEDYIYADADDADSVYNVLLDPRDCYNCGNPLETGNNTNLCSDCIY